MTYMAEELDLPVVMTVANGKVRDSLAKPKDTQAIIAYLEKSLGNNVPENGFYAGGEWRKLSALKPAKPGLDQRWASKGRIRMSRLFCRRNGKRSI